MEVKCPVKNCKYFDKPMHRADGDHGIILYKCASCGHMASVNKETGKIQEWKGAWEST